MFLKTMLPEQLFHVILKTFVPIKFTKGVS